MLTFVKTCTLPPQRYRPLTGFVCFQGESVKNSSGAGDEAQAAAGGRTRSVRSLGTAELIRPQRLKYFESMLPSHRISFLWTLCLILLYFLLKNIKLISSSLR